MELLETAYLIAVGGVVVAGTIMIYLSVEALLETKRPAMIHLSVGFALIVAAAAGTALAAVASNFAYVRSILLANSGFTAVGYLFIVYSLRSYGKPESRDTAVPGFEYVSSRVGRFFP